MPIYEDATKLVGRTPLVRINRIIESEATVAATLVDDGLLRRRPSGYFPAPGLDPHPAVDIRGSAGGQIAILEAGTGRMLGSAGAGQLRLRGGRPAVRWRSPGR